jgi:uncharacterized membrane protein YhaH (DUF805 family)
MNFDTLFANPNGRTARGAFVPALLTLAVAVVFYAFFVKGRTAQFCMLVLLYPAFVLHARRLHDMGHSAWLLAVPALLVVAMFAIRVGYLSLGASLDAAATPVAVGLFLAFSVWGCVGKSQSGPNSPAASIPN